MAWDSDKSTAADPDNPQADEQLTADEWDNHVSEGHFPGDELNFGVDGNGDPVITDPQNGGQTVMRYDRSAGSWVVDTLKAGDVLNSEIGDSVDYSDPRCFVRFEGYPISTTFESLDGFSQTTNGSGTITQNDRNVTLSTGSTDDSRAFIRKRPRGDLTLPHVSWGNDFAQYWLVNFESVGSGVDAYASRGTFTSGNTTTEHVGVGVRDSDLILSVSNGSSETTSTIISNVSTGTREIWVEYSAGDKVEVYEGDRASVDATVSTNLPGGSSRAEEWVFCSVENADSSGSDRSFSPILTRGVEVP